MRMPHRVAIGSYMLAVLAVAHTFVGCGGSGPGWPHYRKAMECHLQAKGSECNSMYERAIAENPALPGVHASYGTHLMTMENREAAELQFHQELEHHPMAVPYISVFLDRKVEAPADATGQSGASVPDTSGAQP